VAGSIVRIALYGKLDEVPHTENRDKGVVSDQDRFRVIRAVGVDIQLCISWWIRMYCGIPAQTKKRVTSARLIGLRLGRVIRVSRPSNHQACAKLSAIKVINGHFRCDLVVRPRHITESD